MSNPASRPPFSKTTLLWPCIGDRLLAPSASFCLFLAAAVLLLSGLSSPASASETERVLDLQSTIQIHADTSLSIRENISVFAAGDKIKRGIIRELPAWFDDDLNYKVNLQYLDFEVTRDGKEEPFFFRREGDSYRLYIGDAHASLPIGKHDYTISYNVLRRLQYFNSYDMLLWSVTGPAWGMPVEKITATVSLPRLSRPILRYSAYVDGKQGTSGTDFSALFPKRGQAVFTLLRPLKQDEDFSIAVAWPKGLVNEPTAMQYYENN